MTIFCSYFEKNYYASFEKSVHKRSIGPRALTVINTRTDIVRLEYYITILNVRIYLFIFFTIKLYLLLVCHIVADRTYASSESNMYCSFSD